MKLIIYWLRGLFSLQRNNLVTNWYMNASSNTSFHFGLLLKIVVMFSKHGLTHTVQLHMHSVQQCAAVEISYTQSSSLIESFEFLFNCNKTVARPIITITEALWSYWVHFHHAQDHSHGQGSGGLVSQTNFRAILGQWKQQ